MTWNDLVLKVFCFFGLYSYKLRRILLQLKCVAKRTTQDTTELEFAFETGSHRVVLELRGKWLSVMGISDLATERSEIPSSVSVSLLQRNSSLHGCAWALLSYGHLKMFIVSSRIDVRTCNSRQIRAVLEAVLRELVLCRETLACIY